MAIDGKKLRPILKPKESKVTDPPRFPNVIVPYENLTKRNYTNTLQKTVNEINKLMVELKKI